MAKLPLYAAGITALFAILLVAAATEDNALLKQAQGIFPAAAQRYGNCGVSDNQRTRRTRAVHVLRFATDD